ncbi:maleylpyruvate isomerase family mycothiol-dependent enzyme [Nocardiopsis halophila]|uniref:maleylpyruvate isomerase family mycothiol-dependent enzyme n=1 Tax=Nocardiopsis halophila TaxID=141692 RepID=UPI00034BC2D8|nr:maleylpyruvate isomerase family mycothiol-dependent enzyme [Nocardiopsis halophila]
MSGREDLWPLIHQERAALAEDLADLTDERWATPSLCEGLTVRQVLAHMTAAATLNGLRWFAGVVRCRFDFDAQVAMRLEEQMGASGAETLERFRAVIDSTTFPPLPKPAILGEAVVHGEDIRRPLGIPSDRPIAVLTRVADYYKGSDQVVVAKSRVEGLELRATDGPFASGAGPLVSGSTLALIMAMTGRPAHLDDLSGDGVRILRERMED